MKIFRRTLVMVWVTALVTLLLEQRLESLLSRFGRSFAPLGLIEFICWFILISITLYWIAVAVRYILRRLFWRVGRRLALSYFLIGALPFVFFAVLIAIIGYLAAAILSQTAFRIERQASLTRLDQWNLEYAMKKRIPAAALPSLEVYDSDDRQRKLPNWLHGRSFSGLVKRGEQPVMISSRAYDTGGDFRTVTFVQPFDAHWEQALSERTGMVVAFMTAGERKGSVRLVRGRGNRNTYNINSEDDFRGAFDKLIGNGIIWADLSPPLVNWNSGVLERNSRLFIAFANPLNNLTNFYFVDSEYPQVMAAVIGSIAAALALIYMFAVLLASGLIFSISRAINRIEKGTKAVERGDFTYRIGMQPRNQLGEVASSFDHMTQSISALLGRVAEQERLQSEIDIAATIQRNLLPKEGPKFRGVSFSAHFEPTASIGGDYYDVFTLDRNKLAVAIGDVSGHGLSTGLVMAMVKAAMSTLVEEGADETSLFKRLNDLVLRSTEKRAFMTLAFTIFDLEKGTIRNTNAGHLYPYLLRANQPPRAIECPSLPLGIKSVIEPATVEISLQENDTIVYLSDGIIEAQNIYGDPYGFDSLEKMLVGASASQPGEIQKLILQAIAKHSVGRPADDDRTVMVLRFDQVSTGQWAPSSGATALPLPEEFSPVSL